MSKPIDLASLEKELSKLKKGILQPNDHDPANDLERQKRIRERLESIKTRLLQVKQTRGR
jgi:hypothetical protein